MEELTWLKQALDKLPSHHRLLLQMRDVDEQTWADIGLVLGISAPAAIERHRALLAKLEAAPTRWLAASNLPRPSPQAAGRTRDQGAKVSRVS